MYGRTAAVAMPIEKSRMRLIVGHSILLEHWIFEFSYSRRERLESIDKVARATRRWFKWPLEPATRAAYTYTS